MDFDEQDNPDEEMGPKLPPQHQHHGSRHRGKGSGGGKYRECLKNHAVGIGGHAVDGCGEFIPAGEEGTLDALRCAACTCHRNFHRKEPPEGGGGGGLASLSPTGGPGADFHHQFPPYYRAPAGYLHHHGGHPFMPQQQRAPAPLALPSTSGGDHSRGEEEEELSDPTMMGLGGSGGPSGGGSSGMKRFRTKFTQEQKDKMLAFAERVGWRIQKHDEAAVQQLCNETAVKRHVLKVWVHNNKHTLGKKQP